MKYLVVGLGNPGAQYDDTRHNIGFDVLNRLAKDAEAPFKVDRLCEKTEVKYKGRTIILIKPTTFMNLSGKAVQYWLQKENIRWMPPHAVFYSARNKIYWIRNTCIWGD